MSLLERIQEPADLKAVPEAELPALAEEIRAFLVDQVSRTGGHLGPNLGVVELTMAIHRVFDSPRDAIVFDTGHQSYVHKLLTGRQDFSGLRQQGGLSGYPSRAESAHDVVESSHASSSLSWAHGIAEGRRVRGEHDRHTVAVIGDGALTGGMAWEALNNIAADKDLPLVIVVNDNERSYAPTKGGLADHLATLRTTRGYEQFLDWGKVQLRRTPVVGGPMERALHGMKKGLKDVVAPQGMFEDLGLKYVGPVNGHDIPALEHALRKARSFGGPVLVHVITQKGRGYEHAVNDEADQFHGIGVINPETGLPIQIAGRSWTDEFSDAMVELGREREDIVAITAAMMIPVGLKGFADAYPDRIFDVGIAEQHAATMAAGLAFTGLHPVVAIYATFLNRAFDQVLMDCALHRAGVTFVLDRSGVTGPDGASHHGMWDLTIAGVVPGLHLAAPRDGQQVPMALRAAADIDDAPSIIRFPKGTVGDPIVARRQVGGVDVLVEPDDGDVDVLIVGIGSMVATALAVADKLTAEGLRVRVIDPVWALPVPSALTGLAGTARRVAVVEDGSVAGGIGSQVAYAVRQAGLDVPVDIFGLPREFLDHGSRGQVLEASGLTADAIVTSLRSRLA
ncbi:MAG TPA: 1-deoxy-D-xylulose-5-phosphate synthase [Phycicoccus elongatus]|uniref:1-deoxy-D-xylulose-5-phosphate synthase n=1 Tax=Phycicoccus TaxID=367298 RepID=UPI002CA652BF|nr:MULTISPECIES: 1-deoxy-D-xylulose-5-phosphate synthase [Phycicoccus]MCA0322509.1 1-deoxy-D-xylulose-5-phosphate synthase [Actinomycetota bacterium]MCB9405658.1 1-deoxy-D-xylulose-5-phosphate synthase [Tetrasphaera sp.]HOA67181.1 1-deoxy-D-xylulose-5-phosphate synthase [Phycicoccus elongatus]HPF75472.1 1-deoxy-D-xylulose-5-phosphate synthase [Phycicoccus elongatus]HPK11690.1 1-deoxy-D-xylulose-5-phosphate synthase [Phycicoccus elongatus]